ncbi:Uncharacterised protein [Mycobacterium tuberculosis]|uniref:Uncharacterized protein n=1 Tax=Mycobacterium tuberculosis TaxID=1773 RepID=A0A654ZXP0_MYCTX|nr:Uncharacterised protein [Mycobacterium tuberculosis]CKR74132.1 Uncharacterised protein [Mycobacterium tuberculosis]CKV36676.1 Uncharacterised protein [Mycobacterium tuberculosis]
MHLLDASKRGVGRVGHRQEPPTQVGAVTGLLEYLPHRPHRCGLARIHFALGQRPVVVTGAVNDSDLDRPFRIGTAGSPEHRTGGVHNPARRAPAGGRVLDRHLNSCRSIRPGCSRSWMWSVQQRESPRSVRGCGAVPSAIPDGRARYGLLAATRSTARRARAPSTGCTGPVRIRTIRPAARSASGF